MRVKIAPQGFEREVVYSEDRWRLLKSFRDKAFKIMSEIDLLGVKSFVIGSIARGDVHEDSDIDIVVLDEISINTLFTRIERLGGCSHIDIVMATPSHTPKIYFYLDPSEKIVVSTSFVRLNRVETEFYMFGGMIDREGILRGERVPGVDKRLMLITPTQRGHIESSILGREAEVAKILGISIETVMDRVKTLVKRDLHGRSGVFLKQSFPCDVSLEYVIKDLCRRNKIFRRHMARDNICI